MTLAVRSHRRWWIYTPLLGLGLWLALFGDKTPADDVAAVAPSRANAAPASTKPPPEPATQPAPAGRTADPTGDTLLTLVPRDAQVPAPSASDASTPVRDPFSARSWTPPPPPPVAGPAPAPVAPPLPYTFLGKKQEGDAWEVYLGRAEQTFIAREGQVLEGNYRIDKVQPPQLQLTYLPLGEVQTLSIGESR
jgi:hypothetical protein